MLLAIGFAIVGHFIICLALIPFPLHLARAFRRGIFGLRRLCLATALGLQLNEIRLGHRTNGDWKNIWFICFLATLEVFYRRVGAINRVVKGLGLLCLAMAVGIQLDEFWLGQWPISFWENQWMLSILMYPAALAHSWREERMER
jgi:hypothetical protein